MSQVAAADRQRATGGPMEAYRVWALYHEVLLGHPLAPARARKSLSMWAEFMEHVVFKRQCV